MWRHRAIYPLNLGDRSILFRPKRLHSVPTVTCRICGALFYSGISRSARKRGGQLQRRTRNPRSVRQGYQVGWMMDRSPLAPEDYRTWHLAAASERCRMLLAPILTRSFCGCAPDVPLFSFEPTNTRASADGWRGREAKARIGRGCLRRLSSRRGPPLSTNTLRTPCRNRRLHPSAAPLSRLTQHLISFRWWGPIAIYRRLSVSFGKEAAI